MQLKRFVMSAVMGLCLAASACWFTQDNFNACYIAGVNNYTEHYREATSIGEAVYKNGGEVASPITVYVKVSERFSGSEGEINGSGSIQKALLQYKVLPNGRWVTVRAIENVKWRMSWNHPVSLFGKRSINLRGLPAGTEVLIRVYFFDGVFETGDLNEDIDGSVIEDVVGQSGAVYNGGWTAPFVFKVRYNGKEMPR